MPIVYEISALYRRTRQPKEYESATAEIGLKAQLVEDDDLSASAATLLDKCRSLTVAAVNGKKLLTQDEGEVSVTKTDRAKPTGRQISDDPEDRREEAVELPEDAEEEKPKARAKAKPKDEEPEEVDLPDEEEDYDPSAFDEDGDEPQEEEISAQDLQAYVTGHVSDKNITVGDAKEIMFNLGDGAGRVGDIPDGMRGPVYAAMKAQIDAKLEKDAKAAKVAKGKKK